MIAEWQPEKLLMPTQLLLCYSLITSFSHYLVLSEVPQRL
jgi:hypothetical protein